MRILYLLSVNYYSIHIGSLAIIPLDMVKSKNFVRRADSINQASVIRVYMSIYRYTVEARGSRKSAYIYSGSSISLAYIYTYTL